MELESWKQNGRWIVKNAKITSLKLLPSCVTVQNLKREIFVIFFWNLLINFRFIFQFCGSHFGCRHQWIFACIFTAIIRNWSGRRTFVPGDYSGRGHRQRLHATLRRCLQIWDFDLRPAIHHRQWRFNQEHWTSFA